jgi:uncharacterized protein YdeI (YjbR/CyaY-like superfamily)
MVAGILARRYSRYDRRPMAPTPFRSCAQFRAWLRKHHARKTELLVSCAKVGAGTGLSYKQALDEALCFGWIDGLRRGIDDDSFSIRFTPRKPGSIWSAVNVRHAGRLIRTRRMRPQGLAAFRARTAKRMKRYSYESAPRELGSAAMKRLRANRRAYRWFAAQAPWYRRTCAFWVTSAKREDTRARRLGALIECCARGVPIGPLKGAKVAK